MLSQFLIMLLHKSVFLLVFPEYNFHIIIPFNSQQSPRTLLPNIYALPIVYILLQLSCMSLYYCMPQTYIKNSSTSHYLMLIFPLLLIEKNNAGTGMYYKLSSHFIVSGRPINTLQC